MNANDDASPTQREEIARSYARERAHAIARRLGLPNRIVKAEIRRLLRAALPGPEVLGLRRWPRKRVVVIASLAAALGAAGVSLLFVSGWWGRGAPAEDAIAPPTTTSTPDVAALTARGTDPAAARIYSQLDRAAFPDLDDLVARLLEPLPVLRPESHGAREWSTQGRSAFLRSTEAGSRKSTSSAVPASAERRSARPSATA